MNRCELYEIQPHSRKADRWLSAPLSAATLRFATYTCNWDRPDSGYWIMDTSAATNFPNRPPRFAVTAQRALTVHVRSAATEDQAVTGQLLDLSAGGAKVLLDVPFRFEQAVQLRLQCDDLGLNLSVAARVCWARPSGQQWRLGCAFEPPLPEAEIQQMLAGGMLDRRLTARESLQLPAVACWELNPQTTAVAIVDYSQGGFCLSSSLPAEPGSSLHLQIHCGATQQQINATVQWRQETGDGFLLGCRSTSATHYDLLQTAARATGAHSARRPRRRLLWGAAIVALAAALARLL